MSTNRSSSFPSKWRCRIFYTLCILVSRSDYYIPKGNTAKTWATTVTLCPHDLCTPLVEFFIPISTVFYLLFDWQTFDFCTHFIISLFVLSCTRLVRPRPKSTTQILFWAFPLFYFLVGTGFINWHSGWWWDPGDHEEMLGGKPVCAVSTHSCGCMAPLPLSPQPRDKQVTHTVSICLPTYTAQQDMNQQGFSGRLADENT